MIYDLVEGIYTIANANFATDLAALATAKGITVTTTATFIMRQNADTFFRLGVALPACGVYVVRGMTECRDQGRRHTTGSAVYDYYAEGADPDVLARQAELAAEALLMSVDRLSAGQGSFGVYGAAELEGSISVEMSDGYERTVGSAYWRRAIVRFTCYDEDTGL